MIARPHIRSTFNSHPRPSVHQTLPNHTSADPPTVGVAVHAVGRMVGFHQAQHAANVGLWGSHSFAQLASEIHSVWLAFIRLGTPRMLVCRAQVIRLAQDVSENGVRLF